MYIKSVSLTEHFLGNKCCLVWGF